MIETVQISNSESEVVWNLVNSMAEEYSNENYNEYFYQCWKLSKKLPSELSQIIYKYRTNYYKGGLLIKGLNVPQNIPPTPISREAKKPRAALLSRKMMCTVLAQIGHIYNFTAKKDFDYVDDVFPIQNDRFEQLGTNSCFLDWHVEDGFHPAKADLVSLFCLRGDINAKTCICEAKDLDIYPEHYDELIQPNFIIEVDPTFDSNVIQKQFSINVLSPGDDPEIVYDPSYMSGKTPKAQAALDHVRECIAAAYQEITLEEGDLLLFDNRRVLHARSAYKPSYDGSDRWLLRALLLESHWKARECLHELALAKSGGQQKCNITTNNMLDKVV